MLVRLTVKLAEILDGVDLTRYSEGDIVELSEREGLMLIAERWAELIPYPAVVRTPPMWHPNSRAVAADRKPRRHRR